MKELLDLGARRATAWKIPVRPGDQRTRPHRHDELELVLVCVGEVVYEVDGSAEHLRGGDVRWLFPDEWHAVTSASEDLAMWVAVASRSLLRALCTTAASAPLQAPGPPEGPRPRHRLDLETLRWADERLAEVAGLEDAAAADAALGSVLLRLWTRAAAAPDHSPVVRDALELLRSQRDGGTLPHLARQLGVSPGHLSRRVAAETGATVTEHRRAARLSRFFELYDGGAHMTMTDAAYAAGFGSYAQFHRVFRGAMGCAPAEHRRREHAR